LVDGEKGYLRYKTRKNKRAHLLPALSSSAVSDEKKRIILQRQMLPLNILSAKKFNFVSLLFAVSGDFSAA